MRHVPWCRKLSQLRGGLTLLLICSAIGVSGVTYAEQCAALPDADPALETLDASTRMDFIRRSLANEARRMRFWNWSWRTTFAAATVLNVAVAQTTSEASTQRLAYEGAAKSAVGTITICSSLRRATGGVQEPEWVSRAGRGRGSAYPQYTQPGVWQVMADACQRARSQPGGGTGIGPGLWRLARGAPLRGDRGACRRAHDLYPTHWCHTGIATVQDGRPSPATRPTALHKYSAHGWSG